MALASDASGAAYLKSLRDDIEILNERLESGSERRFFYDQIVDRVVTALSPGKRVCLVLYGHPAFGVEPVRRCVMKARESGFSARVLPGISSFDCLIADLLIDPVKVGLGIYLAQDYVQGKVEINNRHANLIIQPALVDCGIFADSEFCNELGLAALRDCLLRDLLNGDRCVVYEAAQYPFLESRTWVGPVQDISSADVNVFTSILTVPSALAGLLEEHRLRGGSSGGT